MYFTKKYCPLLTPIPAGNIFGCRIMVGKNSFSPLVLSLSTIQQQEDVIFHYFLDYCFFSWWCFLKKRLLTIEMYRELEQTLTLPAVAFVFWQSRCTAVAVSPFFNPYFA